MTEMSMDSVALDCTLHSVEYIRMDTLHLLYCTRAKGTNSYSNPWEVYITKQLFLVAVYLCIRVA